MNNAKSPNISVVCHEFLFSRIAICTFDWRLDLNDVEKDLEPIDPEKNSKRFVGKFEPSWHGFIHAKTVCNNRRIALWYFS
jgi:hypothetical protein